MKIKRLTIDYIESDTGIVFVPNDTHIFRLHTCDTLEDVYEHLVLGGMIKEESNDED